MSGLRLYELAPAYAYLVDALDDDDSGDGHSHLDALSDAIDAKASGIAHVLAQLDAEAEAMRSEEKRLAARRQARERRAESLRDYLRMSLDAAGVPKIKTSTHTISVGDGRSASLSRTRARCRKNTSARKSRLTSAPSSMYSRRTANACQGRASNGRACCASSESPTQQGDDMSDIIKNTSGLDMVASLADVLRLADTLSQARGGFIPDHFKNSAQVAAVILAGRELGVGPMAALRSFYLVNGKLGMDASFVSGRMLAHGIALEWLRDDDECASVRLSRAGMPPYVSTFSRGDAERAGLWGSATWRKYPRAMLRARHHGRRSRVCGRCVQRQRLHARRVARRRRPRRAARAARPAARRARRGCVVACRHRGAR